MSTNCKKCKFYYGKHDVNCALHPQGVKDDNCLDFTNLEIAYEKRKSNKLETAKAWIIVLSIFGLFLSSAIRLDKKIKETHKERDKVTAAAIRYKDEFQDKCYQFLENAGNAGTSKMAQTELARSMSWLQENYSEERFEYQDLKADLAYLKSLPSDSPLSLAIKSAIQRNSTVIKNTVNRKANNFYKQHHKQYINIWYYVETGVFLIACLVLFFFLWVLFLS